MGLRGARRGYYRCSSSKGCPARKQVERSSMDPTMLVVTYTCEHNHAWPLPKNHHHSNASKQQPHLTAAVKEGPDPDLEAEADPDPEPAAARSPQPEIASSAATAADPEESRFSDLIGEDSSALMMPDDFWYSDVGSTSSTSPPMDTLLYGPIFAGSAELGSATEIFGGGDFKEGEEEDSLFAGLGELPEYSTVFRRSYLERQLAVQTAVHQ